MLQKYVDKQGQVDYKSWLSEKKQLDAYIQTLEKMPPLEMAALIFIVFRSVHTATL